MRITVFFNFSQNVELLPFNFVLFAIFFVKKHKTKNEFPYLLTENTKKILNMVFFVKSHCILSEKIV